MLSSLESNSVMSTTDIICNILVFEKIPVILVLLMQKCCKLYQSEGYTPDSPLPPMSDSDADGISGHRLAPYKAHYRY